MPEETTDKFNQRPSDTTPMSEHEPARPSRSLSEALVADDDIELNITRDRSLGRVTDLEPPTSSW